MKKKWVESSWVEFTRKNRVKNTCGARIFFEILPSEFPKNEQLTFSELKNTGLIRQSVHEWRNRSTSEETLQNISLRVKKPVYEWRNRSTSEETIYASGFFFGTSGETKKRQSKHEVRMLLFWFLPVFGSQLVREKWKLPKTVFFVCFFSSHLDRPQKSEVTNLCSHRISL